MKWLFILTLLVVPLATAQTVQKKPIGEIKATFQPGDVKVLKITNKGTKPFTIKSIKEARGTKPDFFDNGSTCVVGKTVAPNESCTFKYGYQPQPRGSKLLTLTVDTTTEEYVIRFRGVDPK